jgi:hypothetical protein
MSDSSTSSGAAQGGAEELPLWEAALAWCDPTLAQELLDANAAYYAARSQPCSRNPFRTKKEFTIIRNMALVGSPALAPSQRRDAAVTKVEVDLRQRIAARQVVLTGLRVEPELSHTRTALSREWANHMEFGWEDSTVSVRNEVYFDVAGRAVALQPRHSGTAHGLEPAEQIDPRPSRPPGRTSHKPIINAALAAYLSEMGKSLEAFAAEIPNQSHIARALETRLKKLHPDKAKAGGLPGRETIRKHVRDILASALVEKGGR